MSKTALVVVLGDVSRSPRICSHAIELSRDGWNTTILGYNARSASSLPNDIRRKNIYDFGSIFGVIPIKILAFIFKFIFMFFSLFLTLLSNKNADLIVAQNPPSVPLFLVLVILSHMSRARFLIDWHNYGYTILNNGSQNLSIMARFYKLLEIRIARHFMSDPKRFMHICVSKSLAADIMQQMHVNATVYPELKDEGGSLRRTAFTEITTSTGMKARWRQDRPFLLMSSCSWTPDDDMSSLLSALLLYDASAAEKQLPKLFCMITGKGPCKAEFERKLRETTLSHVHIVLPWLEASDYPKLLGCSDLGVCLHKSTSNLDLPMKVVDLFGCGVPVLALNYHALAELVSDKQTGCLFEGEDAAQQLANHLMRLASAAGQKELDTYRQNVVKMRNQAFYNWANEWTEKVAPLLKH
ncbi:mannosyltransferase [Cichlidogyrus casuarinus]|uniref:Mannosyltransferase n=1 Tax=Cichlidogyrus casuarinus TaxID=1844966 RepID=A0ABD2Q6Z3_9PLAT